MHCGICEILHLTGQSSVQICGITMEKEILCTLDCFASWADRDDSMFSPSQWATVSLCNDVSHWLGANLESSLWTHENPDNVLTYTPRPIFSDGHVSMLNRSNSMPPNVLDRHSWTGSSVVTGIDNGLAPIWHPAISSALSLIRYYGRAGVLSLSQHDYLGSSCVIIH